MMANNKLDKYLYIFYALITYLTFYYIFQHFWTIQFIYKIFFQTFANLKENFQAMYLKTKNQHTVNLCCSNLCC